ncbi:hypothetical protein SAMN02910340_02547 [Methanosarcina thermophila]|uniref:DUF5658 domain-containing protein n=3 Tax=Methanosarcina thermophila TaxID=2210 RepID=A0A1I7B4S3_METTE|nr:hypothetical protein [Methanosarcina thermophila]ALK05389.1 MAG: hypothetical protein AAY43_06345 [Methanosarcina sp. 795]AKB14191.1 hypothetical protein MSTHT_2433 [Methanosarcina thermophila TM-1]AKB15167.1 hypothetical protein MSTHC_0849 [Methanosarcina thermophila CHTI-55]NLU58353.1 hypothetical protein [Methanosarcina thermophila]SFT82135.1 hypothetical protein SAMN02910340_02547 [Methanosarcina thermophila]
MEVCNTRGSFSSYLYEIRFIILFYVIGDWASTVYALPRGIEYNPVPAMILENYGIYHLLLIKIGFIFLLFYVAPMIKTSAGRWALTKHIIEFVGIFVTVNNLMVVCYGNSLIQALGLV